MNAFDDTDLWRAIILYGLNTATYKIALGECLAGFAGESRTRVRMDELAEAFFDAYRQRLEAEKPQLATPGRLTKMERIVALHNVGKLDRAAAIERVRGSG